MIEKQYIGLDPGKDGAIVILKGENVTKYTYPLIGKEYDIQAIRDIFLTFEADNCHIVLENVHAIAGGSAKANWSFSRGKAILETLCVSYDLPFTMVNPKAWQKIVHQGIPKMDKAKDMTLLAIKRLYPTVDLRKNERCRKPHDGIYDALGMAHYCKINYGR
jgi:hypothetical protein